MNEQIKRLADEILNFATERRAFATELIDADDIKAALRQAIKQVNQIQHREEQRRAAAQRAAIDKVTGPGGYITGAVIDQARAEFERNEQKLDQAREVAAAPRAAIDRAAAVEVVPLPELDQYFR